MNYWSKFFLITLLFCFNLSKTMNEPEPLKEAISDRDYRALNHCYETVMIRTIL